MKFKFLVLFLFFMEISFSQTEIYYFKDVHNNLGIASIKEKKFSLLQKEINEGYTNATYWFKIPASASKETYLFRIVYDRYNVADIYQESFQLEKLKNQRYLTFRFTRDKEVFIKIKPKLHAYLPIEFDTEENALVREKNLLLYNGFYYGFAFFILMYNLSYFFLFKDITFLYYFLFLSSMIFGVFTMDGMLTYCNLSENSNNFLMILNYILMAVFSSIFACKYLFLDLYFPKFKKFSTFIIIVISAFGGLFLNFINFYFLLVINVLLFSLLFIYWLSAILLYNKNHFTKFLVFAYVIILFSAIDFFILKPLGITFVSTNSVTIKIGAFFEMSILSFGVFYRMKILIKEHHFMKGEIIKKSKELEILYNQDEADFNKTTINELSFREREVFDLIVAGKSNKQISQEVNISVNTVKYHIKNIYGKLNINSRKEAAILENTLN